MVKRHKQSGVALLLVLILVASASVMGFGYVTRSTIKLSASNNLVHAGQARYLAESGLAHGLRTLRIIPYAMANSAVTPLGPYTLDSSDGSYTFYSSPVSGQVGQYTISSSGTAAGITQRVQQQVQFSNQYYDLMMSMKPRNYWRLGETSGWIAEAAKGSEEGVYRNNVWIGWTSSITHDDTDRSVLFLGTNGYVDLGNLEIHEERISLVAWVYPSSGIHTYARIISKSDGTSTQDRLWQLAVTSVGGERWLRFSLKTENGNETKSLTASSGHVALNKWTFVVATYDGAMMRLYKDGVEVGSLPHSGKVVEDHDIDAWIGGDPAWPSARPWRGGIDEVAIFKRALSAAEIKALYEAQVPEVLVMSWDN